MNTIKALAIGAGIDIIFIWLDLALNIRSVCPRLQIDMTQFGLPSETFIISKLAIKPQVLYLDNNMTTDDWPNIPPDDVL